MAITASALSIDLPVFNRNQGNIKNAKSLISNTEATQRYTQATVDENVATSLQKAFAQERLYRSIDPKFAADFERLTGEVHQELRETEHQHPGLPRLL